MAVSGESQGQIQEFLQVIRRRRWQVILPAVFLFALGSAVASVMLRAWRIPLHVEVQQTPENEDYVRNATFFLRDYRRVADVIERQKWTDYLQLSDTDRYDFVRDVLDSIEVQVITGDTRNRQEDALAFIDVSYTCSDPDRGVGFLNNLVESWIKEIGDRQLEAALKDQSNYREAHSAALGEVNKIANQMAEKMKVTNVSWERLNGRINQEEDPVLARLRASELQLDVNAVQVAGLKEQLATKEKAYDDAPEQIIEERTIEATRDAEKIDQIEARIEANTERLEKLQPANPEYQLILETLTKLEEDLQELLDEGEDERVTQELVDNPERPKLRDEIAALEAELRRLDVEAKALQERIDLAKSDYQERIATMTDLNRLLQDKERWEDTLLTAHGSLVAAGNRVALLGDLDLSPFQIAEEARRPRNPEPPSPAVVVVLMTVVGLAIGLGSALMGEFSRNCYRSVHDVTRVMALPVLGVVNTIITGQDLRRARLRRVTVAASSLVLIGGLAWFTWAWKARQDLLPTEVVQAIDDWRSNW